jgi:hypothetical protein
MPLVVLSVIVWLSIPPLLSRAMVRRGYDGGSYVVVGVLFGPLAVLFATMDVLCDVRDPPRILDRGRTGHGDLSVLVVTGGEPTISPPAVTLAGRGSPLRRLGLVRVLPKGGPLLSERQAERTPRQAAVAVDHPELALLFGRPEVVIPHYAAARGYDIVFTPEPDPILSACLKAIGRIHRWGNDSGVLGVELPTAGRFPNGTEELLPASVTSPDPAPAA